MAATADTREALVLGIETSCDETAAAVVLRLPDGQGRILANVVRTQWERHRPYGGVVPEIAARAHVECLDFLIREAMCEADAEFTRPLSDRVGNHSIYPRHGEHQRHRGEGAE